MDVLYLQPGEKEPRPNSQESAFRKQVHQLKRLLGEKALRHTSHSSSTKEFIEPYYTGQRLHSALG